MKRIFLFATACCLYTGSLQAQSGKDTLALAGQKAELKQALQSADDKMAARQQAWYDAQNAKVKYDTIGLAQFRYEYAQLKEKRKALELAFIREHPDYIVSADALKDAMGPIPDDILQYERLFRKLAAPVRKSEEGKKLRQLIEGYKKVRIGAVAPAFSAPDTSGRAVKLTDYRGKYVLVDFWASWCGPCREENPVVVKAYERFKNKSFDVLSVSLDQPGKRADWIKAIHKDGLAWQHVSDLQFWNSAVAKLYMVRSIPQNFLIDPRGKIVAKNLRGEALIDTLEEILK